MASSPLFRSALAKERYRSTQSVPAQSPNDDRYSTPSIGRSAHGFYNRSVTPSSRLRILPPSFDQPEERRALVSDYRLLKAWDEVESRYSHVGLEDDDEIDLATETVHRPDGSTTKLLSHDRRKRRKRRSFGDESKGGRTNEKDGSGDDDDEDSYSEERSDEEEGSSGADSQSIGEGTDDDDEDGMESWTAQEDSLLAQQEEKEAAVMLTKLREGPAIDPEEELAEFHRHEEVLRQRRMSARAEGRDSRCHTDALSGSDDEPKRPMSRSPSRFSTIVAESEHDLFPDMDSSEDEIAVASSDADLDRVSRYPSISSEESDSEDDDQELSTQQVIERARQSRQSMMRSMPFHRSFTLSVTPEPSPKPDVPIVNAASPVKKVAKRSSEPTAARKQMIINQVVLGLQPPAADRPPKQQALGSPKKVTASPAKVSRDKGKGRMDGERPNQSQEPIVINDVFGPEMPEPIKTENLDPHRYRPSRYRQKASLRYKRCRFCRGAGPARAQLAEYCRGANHARDCTFENDRLVDGAETAVEAKSWPAPRREIRTKPAPEVTAPLPITPAAPLSESSARIKKRGLTSRGLEVWRYYESLVKKPDRSADRSCPRCRASDDAQRVENAFYCRGRIDSINCTFDGHKGCLRVMGKGATPASAPVKRHIERPVPPSPAITTTLPFDMQPDTTVDASQLDLKDYYASLILHQTRPGYRLCSDCARSGDVSRRRLAYWCRGRISYKHCRHWDGDETSHRRRGRKSDPGPSLRGPAFNTNNSIVVEKPLPSTSIPMATMRDAAENVSQTKRRWWRDTSGQSQTTADSGAYPAHGLSHPSASVVASTLIARDIVYHQVPVDLARLGSAPWLKAPLPGAAFAAADAPSQAQLLEPVKRKGSGNKMTSLTGRHTETDTSNAPQSEPVKRKPGRPRKNPLPENQLPASDSIRRKAARPRPKKEKELVGHDQQVPTSAVRTPIPQDQQATSSSGKSKGNEAVKGGAEHVPIAGLVKKKRGRPFKIRPTEQSTQDVPIHRDASWSARHVETLARSEEGLDRSEGSPPSSHRRKRARTFDIVVPASRSRSPAPHSTDVARARAATAKITSAPGHGYGHQQSPDVRPRHPHHTLSGRPTPSSTGSPDLPRSLPPSSPPPSPSRSPSAEAQQFVRQPARVYRSSPLAQPDRSSTGFSEGGTMRPSIRGILRQSSEFSDTPRSNKRARFSLVRSPSPESGDGDESSDDELLLKDPNEIPKYRRSAEPSSSRRNLHSSPLAQPHSGGLPPALLAKYASTLDDSPASRLSPAPTSVTRGSRPITPTPRRSSVEPPPLTSRSVPPPSRKHGLMLPPPVPSMRSSPGPTNGPRATRPVHRAQTAGLVSSSTSKSTVNIGPDTRPVAEHVWTRRLIADM